MKLLNDLKMQVWEILEEREPGKWVLGSVIRGFEEALRDEETAEAIADLMIRRVAERQIYAEVRKLMEGA